MAFSRVLDKYALRDLYREHIFPVGEFVPVETARLMVDLRGRLLDYQLAVAELHSAKTKLVSVRDKESYAAQLIETANRAIQCATDAENSGIRDAIDKALHLCKVVCVAFYLKGHDTSRQLEDANQYMDTIYGYITGAIAPPAPMTFEEALELVSGQPEDFPKFFPEV